MIEIVELYVKIWIEKLPKPAQGSTTEEDLLDWTSMCLVFKLSAEFKCITRYAVWETAQKIEVPAFEMAKPIEQNVIDGILGTYPSRLRWTAIDHLQTKSNRNESSSFSTC